MAYFKRYDSLKPWSVVILRSLHSRYIDPIDPTARLAVTIHRYWAQGHSSEALLAETTIYSTESPTLPSIDTIQMRRLHDALERRHVRLVRELWLTHHPHDTDRLHGAPLIHQSHYREMKSFDAQIKSPYGKTL